MESKHLDATLGEDEVLFAIKRPEGYEDVHPDLLAHDMFRDCAIYRVIETPQSETEPSAFAVDIAKIPALNGWPLTNEQQRVLADEVLRLHQSSPSAIELKLFIHVGEYTISPRRDGSFWIEHDSGEGMQVRADLLATAVHAFYKEHF